MSLSCREQGLQAVGVEWAFNKLPSDFPDGLVVGESTCARNNAFDPRSGEDSTHRGTIKPMHPNYGPTCPRSHRSEQSVCPITQVASLQPEKKPSGSNKDPA